MYTVSPDQYDKLQPLMFNLGSEELKLSPNAQIWPCALNSQIIGGTEDAIYLIVNDITGSVDGVDFILGYKFLYVLFRDPKIMAVLMLSLLYSEHYYTVYNTGNKAVGFAPTNYTFATLN